MHSSTIELDAGQPDRAAGDASRALVLSQKVVQAGEFSEHVGRAYLALGRALQAQGKREQARAALRSAAEHLEHAIGPEYPESRVARQLAESAAR